MWLKIAGGYYWVFMSCKCAYWYFCGYCISEVYRAYSTIHSDSWWEGVFFLHSNPGCYTFPNAWLPSKNTAKRYCRLYIAWLIIFVIRWHCCTVEWNSRNPNWWLGVLSCWSSSLLIRLRSFEIDDTKLITLCWFYFSVILEKMVWFFLVWNWWR